VRFACVADLHGHLPAVRPCDVLLVAGDICPTGDERPETQRRWLTSTFADWLEAVPAEVIVGVAGNHDWIGQSDPSVLRDLDWNYLQDESVEIAGISFFGSPWTSRFQDWAFMLTEAELEERWKGIPAGVDVVCVHSPPLGYGDWISGHAIGSPSLLAAIDERAPKLCVFGHVHSGYGLWQRNGSTLVNAALCDMQYRPANAPIQVELG
jgi:Icc-related predicted phosphoesterase